jgi:hypothetical protein
LAAEEQSDPVDRLDTIVRAIAALDTQDSTLWTGSGLPQVAALSEILGEDVSAAERSAAWKMYQQENT